VDEQISLIFKKSKVPFVLNHFNFELLLCNHSLGWFISSSLLGIFFFLLKQINQVIKFLFSELPRVYHWEEIFCKLFKLIKRKLVFSVFFTVNFDELWYLFSKVELLSFIFSRLRRFGILWLYLISIWVFTFD
jgi:hypothetical protein